MELLNLSKSDSMRLVEYPNEILRQKTQEIKPIEFVPALTEITDQMYQVMIDNNGIGLAAPQVGLPYQLFIIKAGLDYKAFFNPKIVYRENNLVASVEACLSLPGVVKTVLRSRSVIVEYQDFCGNNRREQYQGILSLVIQHEYDHLEGKLIIDY